MTPGMRRAVTFLAMVGAGLSVVVLLSDDVATGPRPQVQGSTRHDEPTLTVKGVEQKDWIRITTKETRLDILRPVEVSPGVFEMRAVHRITVAEGTPQPDGVFMARDPVVTILDPLTGEPNGELRSDEARFLLEESVGGDITLNIASPTTDRFTLTGNVRGTLPVGEGLTGHLEAETLDVDGEHVVAPGRVVLRLPEMSLTGHDMDWDGATGHLAFERDCLLRMEGLVGGAWDVTAVRGLDLSLPPDSRDARSQGVLALRGDADASVLARRTDGSTIQSLHMVFDGPGRQVHMEEQVEVDWLGPGQPGAVGGPFRLTARDQARMRWNLADELAWFDADGEVEAWSLPGPRGSDRAHLKAEHLEADLVAGVTNLTGDSLLELLEPGWPASVAASQSIRLRADAEQGGIERIEAAGDVRCNSRGYELQGDTLSYDLAEDYAAVDGGCRLSTVGAWLVAEHIDLWPGAERFRILGSTIHVDG